jgi:hypothetical protein
MIGYRLAIGASQISDTKANTWFRGQHRRVLTTRMLCSWRRIGLLPIFWSRVSDLLEQSGKEEMKRVGRDVTLKSNIAVDLLLKQYLNLEFHQTYATDTFVYVKPGGMSAPVKWGALVQSARLYALPQIEIIRPRMVICLGRGANYSALHNAALGSMPPALEGDSPKGPILWKNSEIYGVTHPSRARMYKTRVQAEWEFLAHRLGQLRGESQFG